MTYRRPKTEVFNKLNKRESKRMYHINAYTNEYNELNLNMREDIIVSQ